MEQNKITSEEDWDDFVDSKTLIEQVNSSFNLLNYIDKKFLTQKVPSSSGWTRKMRCPFHKNGSERTPSLFINNNKNIFYCQACGISGGIVQFIANSTQNSEEYIANTLLKYKNNKTDINQQLKQENQLEKKRKSITVLYNISDLFRTFIINHFDDNNALLYVDKLMNSFDILRYFDEDKVDENVEELYKTFENYLNSYDRR